MHARILRTAFIDVLFTVKSSVTRASTVADVVGNTVDTTSTSTINISAVIDVCFASLSSKTYKYMVYCLSSPSLLGGGGGEVLHRLVIHLKVTGSISTHVIWNPTFSLALESRFQGVESGIEGTESGIQVVESRIQGVESGIQRVEFGIQGMETRIQGVESGNQGVECGIQGVRYRIQGVESRGWNSKSRE